MDTILNVEVSGFKNCNSTTPVPVNLLTWLTSDKYVVQVELIRKETDKDKRAQLKETILPAITPSVLFHHYRNTDNIVSHSGFIAFDIDSKDNTHVNNYSDLKKQITKIQNVAYCGLSVSGNGFWGLIPIADKEQHLQHYEALEIAFKKLGLNIDPKCKDRTRLRIYSYDPEPYFNHHAKPFTATYIRPKPTRKIYAHSGDEDERAVQSCLNQLTSDITSGYGDWFAIGCSLAALGEAGRDYFHSVSRYHPDYSFAQTDRQFNACLKGGYKYSLGTFFHHCKLAGIEPERKQREVSTPATLLPYPKDQIYLDHGVECWNGEPLEWFQCCNN